MKRLKKWLPPELIRIGRHITRYSGYLRMPFASWEEATSNVQGYNAPQILERVLSATLTVRDGKAAFERDSVLFYDADDRFPLLAALMRCAAIFNGHLRVLDFGGALGSSYFQCKPWLHGLASVRWCVVEQTHFVEVGTTQLANDQLDFALSMQAASQNNIFDTVLFSGVLQYLENPREFLMQATELCPRFIIIDRTPCITGKHDIIAIQKQGFFTRVVRSSYPIHLFTRNSLLAAIGDQYRLVSEFDAIDEPMGGVGHRVDFKGYIFERKNCDIT